MKASTKKVKHPKIDPYVISLKQKYELDYIVKKFKKEGITVTSQNIKDTVKEWGKSRRKVYMRLRMQFG